MRRESRLGVLPVVRRFDLRGEQCTAPDSCLFRMFGECLEYGLGEGLNHQRISLGIEFPK